MEAMDAGEAHELRSQDVVCVELCSITPLKTLHGARV